MATTPSTDNYTLGKGKITFNDLDLGNAPSFNFNVELEKLDHFSSRGGIKSKDLSIISQITPTVSFTLDEINGQNMELLALGKMTDGVISAFTETTVKGPLTFTSDNPVGNNMKIEFWNVSLTPSGEVSLIGDDWTTLSFTGEVLKSDDIEHKDSPYGDITMIDEVTGG